MRRAAKETTSGMAFITISIEEARRCRGRRAHYRTNAQKPMEVILLYCGFRRDPNQMADTSRFWRFRAAVSAAALALACMLAARPAPAVEAAACREIERK